jgi:hypothetical protein
VYVFAGYLVVVLGGLSWCSCPPSPPMDSSSSADQDSAELPTEEDFYSVYHVKTRKRTSRHQFRVLEDQFAHNPKPSATVRKHIAAQLEMTARGVQVCIYF